MSFIYLFYLCYMQEEHDDNYEAEAEVADEFDSDFNDDVIYVLLVYSILHSSKVVARIPFFIISFFCFVFVRE